MRRTVLLNARSAVELWDAARFYDRLELAQRPVYDDPHNSASPWARYLLDISLMPEIGGSYVEERW